MTAPVESATRYLRHTLRARSAYSIHSPFVFDFHNRILKNGIDLPEYRNVERIRREMVTLTRYIKRNDLGAGTGERLVDHRFVRVRDIARRTAVTPKRGQFLFRLVRDLNPGSILEFGTSLGISTMYLATAAPGGRVISLEGCRDSAAVARENFEKAGLHNIRVITGRFEQTLPEALKELPSLDFVFFDGNHRFRATMDYFEACVKQIHPGTVFVFDDIHWSGEMETAWKTISRHNAVKVTIDLFHMGIVYFRDELSRENFILRF